MAAPSTSAREDILRAAYGLFLDVGYDKATYQHIAERSGHERPLVQYHIPHKADLATRFLTDVLSASEEALRAAHLAEPGEPISYRYVLAQVYYAALSTPSLRRFAMDALDRRSIIARVLADDIEWNLALIHPDDARRQAVVDDCVMGVGGAYELFLHRLREGQDTNPADLASRTLLTSIRSEPEARDTTEAGIRAHTLASDTLQAAADHVVARLAEMPA